jgi:hypothetical protein
VSRTGPGLPCAQWVVRHSAYDNAMQGVHIRLLEFNELIRKFVSTDQICHVCDEQYDDEPPSLIADSDDEL